VGSTTVRQRFLQYLGSYASISLKTKILAVRRTSRTFAEQNSLPGCSAKSLKRSVTLPWRSILHPRRGFRTLALVFFIE